MGGGLLRNVEAQRNPGHDQVGASPQGRRQGRVYVIVQEPVADLAGHHYGDQDHDLLAVGLPDLVDESHDRLDY